MPDLYHTGNPLVSVIMVTYNRAHYLQRSISSFLNQTFKDAELIVIDDGSDDDTFYVVNSFIKKYPNIRYVKHSNRHISLSKNAGIQSACGKYLAFLDSDDEYRPCYLEKRVRYMINHPGTDLIEGGAIVLGSKLIKDKNNIAKQIFLSECHIGATFFGKAFVFSSIGFDKNIRYSEDSAFWEKAAVKYHVEKFDEPGYILSQHAFKC